MSGFVSAIATSLATNPAILLAKPAVNLFLSRAGAKSGTPHAAILLTGVPVILPQFLDLKTLVEAPLWGLSSPTCSYWFL